MEAKTNYINIYLTAGSSEKAFVSRKFKRGIRCDGYLAVTYGAEVYNVSPDFFVSKLGF